MKAYLFLLLFSAVGFAQVTEISKNLEKRGFIEEVSPEEKVLLVNMVSKDQPIVQEIVEISEKTVIQGVAKGLISSKKKPLTMADLKPGMELTLTVEFFETKNLNQALTIDVADTKPKKISDGRLDYISADYAWIDGNKVKLADGKQFKGGRKGGYGNKTFSKLTELKPDDLVWVDGTFENGAIVATGGTIEPESNGPLIVKDSADMDDYQMLKGWGNKATRKTLLGKEVPGIGRIVNNEYLQDYVQAVGEKILPEHIKKKMEFFFIVINSNRVNANIRPSGLVFVSTALLLKLENEAQLATVLSHEVAHNIYRHISKERNKGESFKTLMHAASTGKKELKADKTGMSDIAEDLTGTIFDYKLSEYNVSQEIQADRVGLSLMAMAGYDPREAPLTWRNLYSVYGKKIDANVEIRKRIDEIVSLNDEAPDEKPAKNKGITFLRNTFKKGKQDIAAKTNITHQDANERFGELCRLIELYYSDQATLDASKTNTGAYVKAIKKLNASKAAEKSAAKAPAAKPKKK